MRWYVDSWAPGYGASFDPGETVGPGAESSAQVDVAVELPADEWRPLVAPADVRAPDIVHLVDGVRRDDATLWTEEDDGASYPALAASYAAGVIRCDLRAGAAELAHWRIDRGLFTASPQATDLAAGAVRYRVHRTGSADPAKLRQAVQPALTELEVNVSTRVREDTAGDTDLLIVDGPLRKRRHLARTVGYVKTQQGRYLPAQLSTVVTALRPGQRCPVFLVGTAWGGYTWYVRLPGPPGAPWAGIVRVECSTDLTGQEAVALANLTLVTLPRFASNPYKDPRAPQNLIPIAGLERRLRGLLGDPRLLHRALTGAAARPGAPPAPVTVGA